jgi:hypothetical protein
MALDRFAVNLSIGTVTEGIGLGWRRVAARAESLGDTWRHVRLSSAADLPQIIRSGPCRSDYEGVGKTYSNFKSERRQVDDWNYETIVEHMKNARKRQ